MKFIDESNPPVKQLANFQITQRKISTAGADLDSILYKRRKIMKLQTIELDSEREVSKQNYSSRLLDIVTTEKADNSSIDKGTVDLRRSINNQPKFEIDHLNHLVTSIQNSHRAINLFKKANNLIGQSKLDCLSQESVQKLDNYDIGGNMHYQEDKGFLMGHQPPSFLKNNQIDMFTMKKEIN